MKYMKELLEQLKKIGKMADEIVSVIQWLKEMNQASEAVDENGEIAQIDVQSLIEKLVRERLQENAK